jgi:hypothetical protein
MADINELKKGESNIGGIDNRFYCRVFIKEAEITPDQIILLAIRSWIFEKTPRLELQFRDGGKFMSLFPLMDFDEIKVVIANEKKDRVDDALCATRAAIEEGIVPGGGVTYIRAIDALEGLKGDNADETTGIEIIKRAIEEPLRQIVANAGKEGAVVVQKVREGKGDFGYNARTDVYEHLHAAGVVDPAKVTRVALENAASIAGMFLTTECVIVEKKEEKPEMPMAAPGMGGMGGMM